MDVIMIKRVRALSNASSRFFGASKWVLILMVFSCVAKYASVIVLLMLGIGPGSHITAMEVDFMGTFICGAIVPNSGYLMSADIPTLCFEIILFVLAVFYFAIDVWESYRPLKPNALSDHSHDSCPQPETQKLEGGKVNELMQIMARDSTIYFALNLAATLLHVGNWKSNPNFYVALSMSLQAFIPFCFAPRLVINVRERDRQVHMRGYASDFSDMPRTPVLFRPGQHIDSLA
ncbi:hypothetical protein HYDPIDRAFT_111190 [Hydnomerulius pinastri MD-312]|uniref:Uncharacterized protein n=1 Tax=Hydnomerulius pinastri MD-312 TaxID=994086 RepID=A0A0C9W2J9_9AGAM|nr:hypothetical protein HYDPIDRAFT_111190 [Hydnomerulius pinastri MD-312]